MESALLLVGAVVSMLVQWLKNRFGTTSLGTLAVLAIAAIVAAVLVNYLKAYGFYEAFLQVLVTAGAFYAFIIRTMSDEVDIAKDGLQLFK